jgi:hypothetical protein
LFVVTTREMNRSGSKTLTGHKGSHYLFRGCEPTYVSGGDKIQKNPTITTTVAYVGFTLNNLYRIPLRWTGTFMFYRILVRLR